MKRSNRRVGRSQSRKEGKGKVGKGKGNLPRISAGEHAASMACSAFSK